MGITSAILATSIAIGGVSTVVDLNKGSNAARKDYLAYVVSGDETAYCQSYVDRMYSDNDISSTSQITVLTHGMGGNSTYWFSKDNGSTRSNTKILFSEDSLPFRLAGYGSSINERIYGRKIESGEGLPIFKFKGYCGSIQDPENGTSLPNNVVVYQLYPKTNSNYFEFRKVDNFAEDQTMQNYISNVGPKVFVYDGINDCAADDIGMTNEYVSQYFQYSLDTVLTRLSMAEAGRLPKVNLIGHSRGGLTNMLYAFNRPKLVNNMVSLATPYLGSSWASSLAYIEKVSAYFKGTEYNMYDEMLNPENFAEYETKFNSLLRNVNTVAFGYQMTPLFLINSIIAYAGGNQNAYDFNDFGINAKEAVKNFCTDGIDEKLGKGNFVSFVIKSLLEYIADRLYDGVNETSGALINGVVELARALLEPTVGAIEIAKTFDEIADYLPWVDNSKAIEEKQLFIDLGKSLIKTCDTFRVTNTGHFGAINSDVCVDTNSQIASKDGYNFNFDRRIITLIGDGNNNDGFYDDQHIATQSLEAVPHNFESQLPSTVNEIVKIFVQQHVLAKESSTKPSAGIAHIAKNRLQPYCYPIFGLSASEIEEYYSADVVVTGKDFNFRNYYYYEKEIDANPALEKYTYTTDKLTIETDRLRCGYINGEKLTLSPNRNEAGLAYFEMRFDKPIYGIQFDISMWSDKENESKSQETLTIAKNEITSSIIKDTYTPNFFDVVSTLLLRNLGKTRTERGTAFFNSNKSLILIHALLGNEQINLSSLSKDRNNPDSTTMYFKNGTTFIGFYAVCSNPSGTNNKGRICIDNLKIYCE